MLLVLGLFTAVFGLSIYQFLTWRFGYWRKRGVSGPKPRPLLGNLPNNFLQNRNVTYDVQDIYREYKGKTPFVGIYQIRQPSLLLINTELIKDVMVRNFKHFQNNGFGQLYDKEINPLLARNPFLLENEEWKEKRAEITPAFTPSRIKALFPLIEDVTKQLSAYIQKQLDKKTNEPFDARDVCAKYTTDVVSSCVFSVDAESFKKENPEIQEASKKLMTPSIKNMLIMAVAFFCPALKKYCKFKLTPVEIEEFFLNLMDDAVTYREDNEIERDDYLAYLIALKKKKEIATIDMAAHGISFFLDGYETSSIALSSVLYELGNNAEVQIKLREEIKKTIEEKKEINFETLNKMSYLDQVFNESLRMHPPVTFSARVCNDPIEIEGLKDHKVLIESGISVIIPTLELHYDSDHYEDPEKFYPERFDAEKGGVKAFIEKGVFIPFGNGPRICLGMRFALAQSKAAIVEIVRNFEISVNKKTQRPLIIDAREFMNVKTGGLWLDFKAI